jgi:hypothetical protein
MSAVLLNECMQVAMNAPGDDDDNEWLDRVVKEYCDNKDHFLDNCNYNDTPNQPPVKHTTGELLERPPANHIICCESSFAKITAAKVTLPLPASVENGGVC